MAKSNWYTRKQFLFTFQFTDEPLVVPTYFLEEERNFTNLCKNVPKYISRGVRISKAFNACGIRTPRYDKWVQYYKQEVEAGLKDTPLIRLFTEVYNADANLDLTLHDLAMDRVEDGDEKMLHFLMKHRLGYNTQRTELSLSNQSDTPFTINIVGMTDTQKPKDDPVPYDDIKKKVDAQAKAKKEAEEYTSIFDENGEIIKD